MMTIIKWSTFGLLTVFWPAAAHSPEDALLFQLDATRVAVISDGDFLASTYADGMLAPFEEWGDVLTVITKTDGRIRRSSIAVPNSVTSAPEILDVSPDGRTFYVVDRLSRATPQSRQVSDLPPGRTLTVVRVGSVGDLSVAGHREIQPSPEAIAVSPDGRWLAIVGNGEEGATLELIPLREGIPGPAVVYDGAELGLTAGSGDPPRKVTLTNVQWHPDGRALAVNDTRGGRIAFFRFRNGRQPELLPWGDPVPTGPDPFVGRFTPNGRFYLTSEWGRDFGAAGLEGRLPTGPGTLGITRLDANGRHERVGQIVTGNNPEGLAISPDGQLVATINMRGTLFGGPPRFTREASVTLIALDADTGEATRLSDTPFEAVLPEGAVFDTNGEHLLATVFQGHEGGVRRSGVVVFRVDRSGPELRLVELGHFRAPRGVHHVVVSKSPPYSPRMSMSP